MVLVERRVEPAQQYTGSAALRWSSKTVKGCKDVSCPNLHPIVCHASLDLSCTDQSCAYKVHVYKCKRFKADKAGRAERTRHREINLQLMSGLTAPVISRVGKCNPASVQENIHPCPLLHKF